MPTLILIRHGESTWNHENRFTGWTDVDLSEKGIKEARQAGNRLKAANIKIDVAFTSVLKRAIKTLWLVLDAMDLLWVPEYKTWRLNERHYGALQGLDKTETAKQYGEDQVQAWRRSYTIRPPALESSDTRCPEKDPKYQILSQSNWPLTESLKDTIERFLPYWTGMIRPTLTEGKNVIIAAHGNTLRGVVKLLDNLSEKAVVELEIPTGIPLIYDLSTDLEPITRYQLD